MPESTPVCTFLGIGSRTSPRHTVNIFRNRVTSFNVVIYLGGNTNRVGQKINEALGLFQMRKFESLSKSYVGIGRHRLQFSSDEEIRSVLEGNPSVIIYSIETPDDLVKAGMILSTKRRTQASVRVILIGTVADRTYLESEKAQIFDFFDIDKEFPVERFAIQVEEAVEEWLSSQKDHERFMDFTYTLLDVLGQRDAYTAGHSQFVAALAMQTAILLGYSNSQIEAFRIGGLLHDIGKIGVRDDILLKHGKLDDREFSEIKRHPQKSIDMLRYLKEAASPVILDVVFSHHERPDGKGYPRGVSSDELPLWGWIMPVVDAFDAMTSTRPYQRKREVPEALRIIKELSGQQFHSDVVRAFDQLLMEGIGIVSDRHLEDLPVAVVA